MILGVQCAIQGILFVHAVTTENKGSFGLSHQVHGKLKFGFEELNAGTLLIAQHQ